MKKMQNKMKNKGKQKIFEKKPGKIDLEQAEIDELQGKYEEINIRDIKLFSDLPLSKKTLNGLKEAHYKTPTPVQRQAILPALQSKDILGAAITGSGKTLCFLIPILEKLYASRWSRMDGVGAVIISPTRELAHQIFETLRKIGRFHEFSAALVIGGRNLKFERGRMDQVNIIICTPGRLLQHMDENALFDCTSMQILVLDEADRILDMGFSTTLDAIIENLPPDRQTLLFSATQTKSVKDLARLSLTSPTYIAPYESSEHATPMNLQQNYVVVELQDKLTMLWSFIKNHLKQKIIVFLSTCKQVRYIYEIFCKLRPGTSLLALYGTLHQDRRTTIYEEFVRKRSVVLFATDIASRGLDFPVVNWVVQLDCPEDATAYIHRAGRAARHKAKGENLLVLLPSEEDAMLEELQQRKIPINKISVDPRRLFNPKAKMEAFLAANGELKAVAQRAFVSYFKSVVMMKNKKIFDAEKLDPDTFAESLGLVVTPRIRYLERIRKKRQKLQGEQSDDDEEEPLEQNFNSIMKQDSESEEDALFTVKRSNHDIQDEPLELPKKKAELKVVTKAAVAKKMNKKKIIPNKKVVFDEDGNMITNTAKDLQSQLAKEYQNSTHGGIDIDKARELLQEEDKFDRKRFKQLVQKKHKEMKEKQKLQEKEEKEEMDDFGSDNDDSDGPDLSWLPDPDKIYGKTSDDSEEEIHKLPEKLLAKKVGKRKAEVFAEFKDRKKKQKKDKGLVEDLSLNDAETLALKYLGN